MIPGKFWGNGNRMSLVADLVARPCVLAAGEYSYRGDRFTFRGELTDETARMASIMCRATMMSATMAARTAAALGEEDLGLAPLRGWVLRGARHTVCVVANSFCMLDHEKASVNAVIKDMLERLGATSIEMV